MLKVKINVVIYIKTGSGKKIYPFIKSYIVGNMIYKFYKKLKNMIIL